MEKKLRIGIALSGGGARGVAHLGVFQALAEEGIQPSFISGTSAGAIAGVLLGAGWAPSQMLEFVKQTSLLKMIRPHLPYSGLISLTYLKERLLEVVPEDRFEALRIPLIVATSNLNSGRCDFFQSGTLSKPVMASSAIPMLFKPVKIEDHLYVDGGVINNLPVDALQGKADFVLAINVMPDVILPQQDLTNVFQVGTRTFELSVIASSRPSMAQADFVIEPAGLRNYNMFSLNRYREIHQLGYETTKARMPDLLARIEQRARELNQ